MKFRLVVVIALAAIVVAACGPGRSTTTLPKLPVEASPGGAGVGAASAAVGPDAGGTPPSFATTSYRLDATLRPLAATAPAYDIAGTGTGSRHRIAAALGVADSDRHLVLGPGSWSFDAGCPAPPRVDMSGSGSAGQGIRFACASPASSAPGAGPACVTGPRTICPPEKRPAPPRPADLPSKTAAAAQARSLFRSLGADMPVGTLQVTDEISRWLVAADPVIAGLPTTGRRISVTIGPKASILTATGFLGIPTKLGDYPLVDASTVGFKRLLDAEARRPRPMIAAYPWRADVADCGEPLTPQVITVTGVHLALQQLGARLVPIFIFEAGPNDTAPPVPAVTDAFLQSNTPTEPTIPQTEPEPPQPAPGKAQPPTAGAAPTRP
jgi:hypothetical protein